MTSPNQPRPDSEAGATRLNAGSDLSSSPAEAGPDPGVDQSRPPTAGGGPSAKEVRKETVARQREAFGGIKWGSAFFGWLSATGLGVILLSLASAAGVVVGVTTGAGVSGAAANAASVGIVGGIVLLVVLMLAYYAGGYVAGRMSRFDGIRQGVATWLIGLLVTIALAVAGVVLGAQYNVLSALRLPAIPVGADQLTRGGLIALAAVLAGTLLAAVAGGKAGEHYHRKVDKAGLPS